MTVHGVMMTEIPMILLMVRTFMMRTALTITIMENRRMSAICLRISNRKVEKDGCCKKTVVLFCADREQPVIYIRTDIVIE